MERLRNGDFVFKTETLTAYFASKSTWEPPHGDTPFALGRYELPDATVSIAPRGKHEHLGMLIAADRKVRYKETLTDNGEVVYQLMEVENDDFVRKVTLQSRLDNVDLSTWPEHRLTELRTEAEKQHSLQQQKRELENALMTDEEKERMDEMREMVLELYGIQTEIAQDQTNARHEIAEKIYSEPWSPFTIQNIRDYVEQQSVKGIGAQQFYDETAQQLAEVYEEIVGTDTFAALSPLLQAEIWRVNDKSPEELGEEFYQHSLAKEKKSLFVDLRNIAFLMNPDNCIDWSALEEELLK